jgi:hypothetical protein
MQAIEETTANPEVFLSLDTIRALQNFQDSTFTSDRMFIAIYDNYLTWAIDHESGSEKFGFSSRTQYDPSLRSFDSY